MTHKRLRPLVALAVFALVIVACGKAPEPATPASPSVPPVASQPKDAPAKTLDFELQTLEGKITTLAALRAGKPALVEFWGST